MGLFTFLRALSEPTFQQRGQGTNIPFLGRGLHGCPSPAGTLLGTAGSELESGSGQCPEADCCRAHPLLQLSSPYTCQETTAVLKTLFALRMGFVPTDTSLRKYFPHRRDFVTAAERLLITFFLSLAQSVLKGERTDLPSSPHRLLISRHPSDSTCDSRIMKSLPWERSQCLAQRRR